MNEMYKYLREHNYISRNENKDALRQQELSRVRAECIANKYDNLTEELQQENKQLKDNWNELKEIAKSQSGFKKRADLKGGLWFEVDDLLDKMQELQGSGSDVKD